eukprot:scaffold5668_cov111-Isochrysis_galbana.AAC.26
MRAVGGGRTRPRDSAGAASPSRPVVRSEAVAQTLLLGAPARLGNAAGVNVYPNAATAVLQRRLVQQPAIAAPQVPQDIRRAQSRGAERRGDPS